MAIDEARKCQAEDARTHPKVGVVVVKDDQVLATAYRGELRAGDHAEYTALEGKLSNDALAGSTVYTTLEPCISRKHPKSPCAKRLIERKVARVVIGMLDPNPQVSGRGERKLRDANIATDFCPPLKAEVEELNREFIDYHSGADTWFQLRSDRGRYDSMMQQLLPDACEVRLCGWSLVDTIHNYSEYLRTLKVSGRILRLLILDPQLAPIRLIDRLISDTDPRDRRSHGWPPLTQSTITQNALNRVIKILIKHEIVTQSDASSVLRMCRFPLPCSLTMIETVKARRWISMRLVPIHPDIHFGKRLVIDRENPDAELWEVLKEQFDLAWEDPSLSRPLQAQTFCGTRDSTSSPMPSSP